MLVKSNIFHLSSEKTVFVIKSEHGNNKFVRTCSIFIRGVLMDKLNVLICCGAGMSSGFLAQQMRVAAKKANIMAKVEAKSQAGVEENFDETDILLVGPHLSYMFDELKEKANSYNLEVILIPKEMYASLDGEGLLNLCIETLKGEKNE